MKYISFKKLLPKLYRHIPGLIKGSYYCITAASGVGKTRFAKFLFVQHAINYCRENNIPLKIIYFALEESKEKFFASLLIAELKIKYNVDLNFYQYMGFYGELSDDIKAMIKDIEETIMPRYRESLLVFDNVSNPTGMYKTVRKVMETLGAENESVEEEDEYGNKYRSFNYEYFNPDTTVIVVCDHVSLISPERNDLNRILTPHEAIGKWSDYVMKYITRKYKCIVCNVHQQESASDNLDSFKNGKLEPELNKLGNNKELMRDYHIVIGLFDPSRYNLSSWENHKILNYGNKFRGLIVLKHRDGELLKMGTLFDANKNYYSEL